ncbi:cellulose synthase subunit BcsC-related outer membrane protein [Stenotrophobium rhamnosiphilum]|uniref:Cellulose synthase operon C C-terminal domain-containing protein n=1 Tax=Stenotrophobium rhamnosiphilum TaxID=2029166 RepID=A0A2T5MEJ7_9GAMM|nr:cellulose synthase subunit BcsC-related outer membrane protein [Stenotrophobium rhamnosiphilum]PTU30987.1 hypothetical protein CJD38_11830 [Stenotrophobium rhamnosiphilum]
MRIAAKTLALILLLMASTVQAVEPAPAIGELLSSARLWQAKNRPDLARLALEKLLLAYPNQPDALLELGELEIRSARVDVAARLLQKAQAAHPGERLTIQFEDLYRVSTKDRLRMATINRLQQSGKSEEALKELRELFPNGPPMGQLGLQYYRVVSGSRNGWDEARAGYSRLARENPENPQYALALADHLLDRPATRATGMNMLAKLSENKDADHQRVMDLWDGALKRKSGSGVSTATLHDDVEQVPNEKEVQARLAARARSEQAKELIANNTLSKNWADDQAEQSSNIEKLLLEGHLKYPKKTSILEALGALRLHQKHYDEAWELFRTGRAYDSPKTLEKWNRRMSVTMFAKWMAESDAAREKNDLELSARKLRAALAINEGSYYTLGLMANRLVREKQFDEAEDIYRHVLALDEVNDTSLRGYTALLSSTGRSQEALALLQDLRKDRPADQASIDVLRAGILRDQADVDIAANRLGPGLRTLETAQQLAPNDPWIRFDLANLYVRLGVSRQARELMDEGVRNAPAGETDIYYAQSLLLASLDDDQAANAALNKIPADQRSDSMNRLSQRLDNMKWRREKSAELAQADRDEAAGHYDAARAIYAKLVAERSTDVDLHLAYARLLRRAGDRAAANAELNAILSSAATTDFDTRLAVAKERMYLGDLKGSREIVTALLEQQPANPDVLVQAGRIERADRHYESAMAYFRKAQAAGAKTETQGLAPADAEIASLQQRRSGGFVTSGPTFRNKSGDPGISSFADVELPIEWRYPINYEGQMFVHLDPAHISAGTLPTNFDEAGLFGKVQALNAGADLPASVRQSQSGADVGVGYQNDNWRFDIGTTPLGFLVQDIVGGVKYDGKLGDVGYSVDVSRRPVTSSFLSYAGARDPITGQVWGGVRSNGAELNFSRYEQDWDASASIGFHRLTGRNVSGNNYFSARVSGGLNLINRDDVQVSIGLSATQWNYSKDLSHYTFGQGGYYSPQSYTSLGVPLEWTGRVGRWSYQLKGSASYSLSRSDDSPFYPNDPALQTLAVGSTLPSGYSSPVYDGGSSSGIGYALKGAMEYQINSDYFIGTIANMDRSAYYAPNFFNVYVRRVFTPWTQAVPYPPRPPKPYSQY